MGGLSKDIYLSWLKEKQRLAEQRARAKRGLKSKRWEDMQRARRNLEAERITVARRAEMQARQQAQQARLDAHDELVARWTEVESEDPQRA